MLLRYVCFSLSTAGVEQNFSEFKRNFGEQGLAASGETEQRMLKIVLSQASEDEKAAVVKRAQERAMLALCTTDTLRARLLAPRPFNLFRVCFRQRPFSDLGLEALQTNEAKRKR